MWHLTAWFPAALNHTRLQEGTERSRNDCPGGTSPYRSDYPINVKGLHFSVILLRMFLCSVSNHTLQKSSQKVSFFLKKELEVFFPFGEEKKALFKNQLLYFVYTNTEKARRFVSSFLKAKPSQTSFFALSPMSLICKSGSALHAVMNYNLKPSCEVDDCCLSQRKRFWFCKAKLTGQKRPAVVFWIVMPGDYGISRLSVRFLAWSQPRIWLEKVFPP